MLNWIYASLQCKRILQCERWNVVLPSWTFKLIENWGELKIDSKGEVDESKKNRRGGEFSFFLPTPPPLVFQLLSRNL